MILARLRPLPPFEQHLLDAHGHFLAEDVTAERDLPAFDNSAMDGYAVRLVDVLGASEQNPALFSTRMQGPNGLFVVVHTTPSDTPAFSGAPIDSRTTVTAPNFGTATKIVFQGNSNFPECEGGLCVDYLIPSGAGGYAILAGGGGDIGAAEEVTAHMLETLQG